MFHWASINLIKFWIKKADPNIGNPCSKCHEKSKPVPIVLNTLFALSKVLVAVLHLDGSPMFNALASFLAAFSSVKKTLASFAFDISPSPNNLWRLVKFSDGLFLLTLNLLPKESAMSVAVSPSDNNFSNLVPLNDSISFLFNTWFLRFTNLSTAFVKVLYSVLLSIFTPVTASKSFTKKSSLINLLLSSLNNWITSSILWNCSLFSSIALFISNEDLVLVNL